MEPSIIVALLSLAGTLTGSIFGIMAANKMVDYRLEKIENAINKMDEMNIRLFALEETNKIQDYKIETIDEEQHRLFEDIKTIKSEMREKYASGN